MIKSIKSFLLKNMGPLFQGRFSYAQEGEDLALDRLIAHKRDGFYVEVGCHHPFRFSNTYFFYKKGWSGVCIDPLPGTEKKFKKWRPRDQVVEVGVARNSGSMLYYMFNEPALNTFDKTLAEERDGYINYKIIDKVSVKIKTLESILDDVNCSKEIDFFSIDVEGLDLEVLMSNNWSKYRPKMIIAESLTASLTEFESDPLVSYLLSLNYKAIIKTGCSVIFIGA